ncbi:MAG: patatin-like phospholipase family protein [Microthrixaceae bacterium]|nr:patatin-like phospholipase family protein [Microthrixaceae bacterium]MCB1012943.1 patatin-like phospholipase family protein [Microthrixaceae bacterium]MCB9386240.1 patatin-like phospholipase family protein [Microthrixaceae bacterium]
MSDQKTLLESLPQPIGFVLGGGGSLGAQQVGMLQALGDLGIHADLVVGTSIGSVNGAVVAADPIGAASRLSHLWLDLDPASVMGKGMFRRIVRLLRGANSIYDTPEVAGVVAEQVGDIDIADLSLPYGAIVVDVREGVPTRLSSGRLATAIEASTAIPGVFPMVRRNQQLLCDGGLITNVAVMDALEMGAQSLVVLDCMFASHRLEVPTRLMDTALWTVTTQLRQQVLRDLPLAGEKVPVLYLPGSRPIDANPLDFRHTTTLMRDAYEHSRAFLATVSVNGPGVYQARPHEEFTPSQSDRTPTPSTA